MIVLTRKQVNLIRMGGILLAALCCGGLLIALGGGILVARQQPELLARLGLPIESTKAISETLETPAGLPELNSPLGTPGALVSPLDGSSPLPTPTVTQPPTPTPPPPTPTPPPPTPTPPPAPTSPPAPTATPVPRLVIYYVASDSANLREKPDTAAKIVRKAVYGEAIQVYEDSVGQKWYRVAGEKGDEYITANLTSKTVPSARTQVKEQPTAAETPKVTATTASTPAATPTEGLPTPIPGKGLLIVYNDTIGQEITFSISSVEYKLNYGTYTAITLDPKRYSWTMSAPYHDSVNHDIEILPNKTEVLRF